VSVVLPVVPAVVPPVVPVVPVVPVALADPVEVVAFVRM